MLAQASRLKTFKPANLFPQLSDDQKLTGFELLSSQLTEFSELSNGKKQKYFKNKLFY